jgi:hypothetical protein
VYDGLLAPPRTARLAGGFPLRGVPEVIQDEDRAVRGGRVAAGRPD